MLAMPRPKTEPPTPPRPNMSDEELDKWAIEYDEWAKVNNHLPNLQPSKVILQRIKGQPQQGAPAPAVDNTKLNTMDAKIQALEVKIDKIMNHFGVK